MSYADERKAQKLARKEFFKNEAEIAIFSAPPMVLTAQPTVDRFVADGHVLPCRALD